MRTFTVLYTCRCETESYAHLAFSFEMNDILLLLSKTDSHLVSSFGSVYLQSLFNNLMHVCDNCN